VVAVVRGAAPAARVATGAIAAAVPVAVAVAARVAIAVRASSSSVPTGSRCRVRREAIAVTAETVARVARVPAVVVVAAASRVRRARHGRPRSPGSGPTGSRFRPGHAASASRSAPTPTAWDPTELLGIPSVARSVRPSVPPSARRTAMHR